MHLTIPNNTVNGHVLAHAPEPEPDPFAERSKAYLAECAAWRARERRMGPDWGLLVGFAGAVVGLGAPLVAFALADGTGPERAMLIAFAMLLVGAVCQFAGLPFHFARRRKNPRPMFRSC